MVGPQRDQIVERVGCGVAGKRERAGIGANHRAVGGTPAVVGFEQALRAALADAEVHMLNAWRRLARGMLPRPEVDAVDQAVAKPERFVVDMVMRLSLHVRHHRPGAGDRFAAGHPDRKEDWLRMPLEDVAGEGFPLDRHVYPIFPPFQYDVSLSQPGRQ